MTASQRCQSNRWEYREALRKIYRLLCDLQASVTKCSCCISGIAPWWVQSTLILHFRCSVAYLLTLSCDVTGLQLLLKVANTNTPLIFPPSEVCLRQITTRNSVAIKRHVYCGKMSNFVIGAFSSFWIFILGLKWLAICFFDFLTKFSCKFFYFQTREFTRIIIIFLFAYIHI